VTEAPDCSCGCGWKPGDDCDCDTDPCVCYQAGRAAERERIRDLFAGLSMDGCSQWALELLRDEPSTR